MPGTAQPTQREMLVVLGERMGLAMKMLTEITNDNKIRNGRIEKLERNYEIGAERYHSRHEALLTRITSIEQRQLTDGEMARIRSDQDRENYDGENKRRVRIEAPFVILGTLAVLASPATALIIKLWG